MFARVAASPHFYITSFSQAYLKLSLHSLHHLTSTATLSTQLASMRPQVMKLPQLFFALFSLVALVAAEPLPIHNGFNLNPRDPRLDCSDCQAYLDKCFNACGPKEPHCWTYCLTQTCAYGPHKCSSGSCGHAFGCSPSTRTEANPDDIKARDATTVDPCAPCTSFFTNCINTCPVKIPMGCANVCKFKTCNIVGHLCPADCDLGLGATLDDCPKT